MLDVGLIGLGSDWESRYRPAIRRMQRRLRVCAVYTPVFSRTEAICAELGSVPAESISDLLARPAVQGVLVLDGAWFPGIAVELACDARKSVLVAERLTVDRTTRRELAASADDQGVMLMPDLLHRHMPATVRLRELIATRLGRLQDIRIELAATAKPGNSAPRSRVLDDLLAIGLDWCHYIAGAVPSRAQRTATSGSAGSSAWQIDFGPLADRSHPPRAAIEVDESESAELAAAGQIGFRAELKCQQGRALVSGCNLVEWETSDESRAEHLTGELDACEVILDHFARRILGGLIPMATLSDALRALEWSGALRSAGGEKSAMSVSGRARENSAHDRPAG